MELPKLFEAAVARHQSSKNTTDLILTPGSNTAQHAKKDRLLVYSTAKKRPGRNRTWCRSLELRLPRAGPI